MGDSLDRGHVATFSLWDDIDVNMMWLDSCYPTDESCSNPGVRRGMCQGGVDSSPKFVREKYPSAYVTFANVAFGEIGTTQSVYPEQNPSPTSAPTAAPSTASTSSAGFLSTSTQPPVRLEPQAMVAAAQARGNNVEDRILMDPPAV